MKLCPKGQECERNGLSKKYCKYEYPGTNNSAEADEKKHTKNENTFK
jgi:hypothetical protein